MPALINSSAVQLIGQLQLQRAKLGAPNVMCVCVCVCVIIAISCC